MAHRVQAIRKTKIENLMSLTNQMVDVQSALLPSHDPLSPLSPTTPNTSTARKKRSILIGNFQNYVGTPLFRSSSFKLNKKNEEEEEKLEDYFQKLDSEFPLNLNLEEPFSMAAEISKYFSKIFHFSTMHRDSEEYFRKLYENRRNFKYIEDGVFDAEVVNRIFLSKKVVGRVGWVVGEDGMKGGREGGRWGGRRGRGRRGRGEEGGGGRKV